MAGVVSHLCPIQGEKNMALNHFTFILSMNPCKHYKESTGYTPDVVHYKLDSSFQVTDFLTREYALINLY